MQTSWKLESCFQPIASLNSDETDGAVVAGDAVAHVLDSEDSTVVTTFVSTPAYTFFSVSFDMQSMPVRVQSYSCNIEGAVGPEDEHSLPSPPLQTQGDC